MPSIRVSTPSDLVNNADGFASGLTDFNSPEFKRRREILERVHSLQSLGLEGHLDIPLIAVVGSQSAGKSSLIEAISGITLPRNIGTCTRCPIECRLTRSDNDWSCEVYIRRRDQEIIFGSRITDKFEVEERIRRAQLAILSGAQDPREFLTTFSLALPPGTPTFSNDVVSVRISDRNLEDLSFVDLPGLIVAGDNENDEEDIDQVERLVASYISKPSCIILLVVACETDPKNQIARRITKRIDPRGLRTIPVLTKADCISPGAHELWLELLRDKAQNYKHPWHIVKQPNQEQLDAGITWDDAREEEKAFFKHTPPWFQLDQSIKARMGTTPLVRILSDSLFELICKRLPELLHEVEDKIGGVEADLSELPAKPDADSIAALCKLLEAFKRDVTELVKGRPDDEEEGLLQKCRDLRNDFTETIFSHAPTFVPIERSSLSERYQQRKIATQQATDPPETSEQRLEPPPSTDLTRFVYLDEVRKSAESGITRELPGNYPYSVKQLYVQSFTKEWKNPAMKLFEDIKKLYSKEISCLVKRHFGCFFSGGLDGIITRIVNQLLEKCYINALERINHCIALEREEPFTSNGQDLASYKCKYTELYRETRKEFFHQYPQLKPSINAATARNKALDDYLNQNMARFKDTILTLMDRDHDEANGVVDIMAEVRAYYQVAFKRFVDNIYMNIDYELLKGFARKIESALFREFALGGSAGASERCAYLLQEDPYLEARREELYQDLERLKLAYKTLEDIPALELPEHESGEPSEGTGLLDVWGSRVAFGVKKALNIL